jgi:hypothetical protein
MFSVFDVPLDRDTDIPSALISSTSMSPSESVKDTATVIRSPLLTATA